MNHTPIFLIAAVILAACNTIEPYNPYNGGDSKKEQGVADFTYEVISKPYVVQFKNKSTELYNYWWDFGDGKIDTESVNPTHTYSGLGTYTVTLKGYIRDVNSSNYVLTSKSATIKLTKPNIYVAGYRLVAVQYYNKYYKVSMADDDWFTTNWGFTTTYSPIITQSDIPYTKYFNSPIIMDHLDGDNYYTVYLYYSDNTSKDGSQCLKQKIYTTDIYKYPQYHKLSSDNGKSIVEILMQYN